MNVNLEKKLLKQLKDKKYQISFAESCTGGLLVSTLINASGASDVLSESYITYSNEAKEKILGVSKITIDKYSVYSKEVSIEMAKGLNDISNCNVAVGVTGEAESNNGVCKCYYTIIINNVLYTNYASFTGSRNEVRTKQVAHIFNEIIALLTNN